MLTDFPRGLRAHARGVRFALQRKGYLAACLVPFLLTLVLYAVGLALMAANGDHLLGLLWTPAPETNSGVTGALAWVYVHIAKYLLYFLTTILMYFLFMVVANILAAPLYDRIAENLGHEASGGQSIAQESLPFWRSMLEECKKAFFVALLPLALFFVPVVGQLLSPVAAAILLAFDFLDYALCRDEPRFAARVRFITQKPLLLLGFGLPLLIPVLNIALFPFAILGSTLLYLETTGRPLGAAPKQSRHQGS